ncbi:L-rhamnose mutarotase [Pleomorphovibrio marinus]|uniref:L-rhamnose mutarotase n=1 Tax=Pleomorphovibrio marinus TaxID=2164132 RepID=UPI000E0A3D0F|nr:L-rhamnose mutarotase [Pleomorphovibrio marinus]
MQKYCLALDLKDDPQSIDRYIKYHQKVPEPILKSIKEAGILKMEIFLTGNRLMMLMEVSDDFDFEKKARMDAENQSVQEWESVMSTLQQALPWAKEGQKWVPMQKIFSLTE